MLFTRYVALGDSFTEGIGDPHPASRNGMRGWADRVAGHLAQHRAGFGYANLAIRGHSMDTILANQIEPAVLLEPDLVTIYAGMNDLLAWRTDIDAMMARYGQALKTLKQTGATVLTFTAPDLGGVPLFRWLRGRLAVYNELLRALADDLDLSVVDFWRLDEFSDPRLWDTDRVHPSPLGHERMAARVLEALAVPHELAGASTVALSGPPPSWDRRANLGWAASFAAPWVLRRLRRMTPGAGVEPKWPSLSEVDALGAG